MYDSRRSGTTDDCWVILDRLVKKWRKRHCVIQRGVTWVTELTHEVDNWHSKQGHFIQDNPDHYLVMSVQPGLFPRSVERWNISRLLTVENDVHHLMWDIHQGHAEEISSGQKWDKGETRLRQVGLDWDWIQSRSTLSQPGLSWMSFPLMLHHSSQSQKSLINLQHEEKINFSSNISKRTPLWLSTFTDIDVHSLSQKSCCLNWIPCILFNFSAISCVSIQPHSTLS